MQPRNRLATLAFLVLTLAAALIACTSTVHAETPMAGSVLIFPLYDSSPGSGSIICVTNTQTSMLRCSGSDDLEGDVRLHYTYFNGETCREFDRYEYLTPGDTLCVIADDHNPEGDRGFLVVTANAPEGGRLWNFNHLIGQAIVVQSDLNFSWSYTPLSFLAQGAAGDLCDRDDPDDLLGDGDGAPDFDGVEYEQFPRELAVPTFFEEGDRFGNQLTLMSTAGDRYENEIRYLIYNNVEDPYSRTQTFTCWWSGPLSEISASASNLRGDPEELGHNTQTGWVSVRGRTLRDQAGNPVLDGSNDVVIPPILGVFMQLVKNTDYAMGDALYGRDGTIDGLELPFGNRDFD